jgi:hypothetical protein
VDNLIEALQIMRKYANPQFPTNCEHDVLHVCVPPGDIADPNDLARLAELGFDPDEYDCGFNSTYFGSC